MTDKQMIIHGVDVSECKYIDIENFEKPICHCISQRNECEMPCEYNKDCYFKQLARMKRELEAKDKECESLGHTYLETNELLQDKTKALTNLKSENDGLKTMLKDLSYENQKFCYQIEEQTKQLEPFKDEYFKGLDNVAIAKLAKKSIRITAENSKLEQTLTEIKDIAEGMNEECFYDDFDCMNCDMQNGCTYFNKKQILQKISEC